MQVVDNINTMQQVTGELRHRNRIIGFVPTMGYFHEGHLSLMRAARDESDAVVASIYVNPLQFGPAEDLDRYPRDFERDRDLAQSVGVDYVYYPDNNAMYPAGYGTTVTVKDLSTVLCGASRPGHFDGVTTVVAKLFHIVQPHLAYFGQKDAQQAIILRKMAIDLNFPLKIIVKPTVREKDNLAMSSRNVYLNPGERQQATALFESLNIAKELVSSGQLKTAVARRHMTERLNKEPDLTIDYLEFVDPENLQPMDTLRDTVLIAGAVFLGKTRLIDNIVLRADTGEEVNL